MSDAGVVGFVVWDEKYGLSYRGKLYDDREKADAAREGIVWHSRERYVVRPVIFAEEVL